MAVMPLRLAVTDANEPLSALIGSGPFRFVANEFSANSLAVVARFEDYSPRNELASGTAGGRIARVERVEWRIIPEPSTQIAALMTGEIDWLPQPIPDAVPRLRQNRDVVVKVIDHFGFMPWLRPNHAVAPTANVGVRRAIMAALDGKEILAAAVGTEPGIATAPVGLFPPGSPYESELGMERLGPKPPHEVKAMLRDAGYQNERLVLLHQSDVFMHDAMLQVIAKRLAEAGLNVDDQRIDIATMVKRRSSREDLDHGGWSLFFNTVGCADWASPLLNGALRTGPAAFFGWPDDPEMERLYTSWLDVPDDVQQKRLAARIQQTALGGVLYVPLGRYVLNSAWRSNVSEILPGNQPVMWNIAKL